MSNQALLEESLGLDRAQLRHCRLQGMESHASQRETPQVSGCLARRHESRLQGLGAGQGGPVGGPEIEPLTR